METQQSGRTEARAFGPVGLPSRVTQSDLLDESPGGDSQDGVTNNWVQT